MTLYSSIRKYNETLAELEKRDYTKVYQLPPHSGGPYTESIWENSDTYCRVQWQGLPPEGVTIAFETKELSQWLK